ncbi:hypothetical protein C8A03DRAFT_29732 [Achaetomium macrosporum]|uniref:Uncharacterized protein n=1 Tax=Achaetomium macrosporum TaxID=79813 RepID=A0AAN7HEH7_9PEZI|nr:hypothetical protein C8A03DRAFT_29732 [Achaetomium macrosporum]
MKQYHRARREKDPETYKAHRRQLGQAREGKAPEAAKAQNKKHNDRTTSKVKKQKQQAVSEKEFHCPAFHNVPPPAKDWDTLRQLVRAGQDPKTDDSRNRNWIDFDCRHDAIVHHKAANFTLKLLESDKSRAGIEFGHRELEITGANKQDFVVVIGEILPEDAIEDTGEFHTPSTSKQAASTTDFDSTIHSIIPTQEKTHIFVWKLVGTRANFFALINKQDGLCETSPPPKQLQDSARPFY